jgi:hypothetical protein
LIQINPEKHQPHHIAAEDGQCPYQPPLPRSPGLPLRGFSLICGDGSAALDYNHTRLMLQSAALALMAAGLSALRPMTATRYCDETRDVHHYHGSGTGRYDR